MTKQIETVITAKCICRGE